MKNFPDSINSRVQCAMSYYQGRYGPPKRDFDFLFPAQLHPLDHSIRILTDEDYFALYPSGIQPVVQHPPLQESTLTPPQVPPPLPHHIPKTPIPSLAKPPLTAFQALKDSTQKTMRPVKKTCLTLPSKKTPVKPEFEKPDGYFKRPDGSLYYHSNGFVCDRGFITTTQS